MKTKEAYNAWAVQYDSNQNKTRDLEAIAIRETLKNFQFRKTLEVGCGTGKNSLFLAEISQELTAVDVSENMLEKAREKMKASNVRFVLTDINKEWLFQEAEFDLVTFSLVLEHIKDLQPVFQKLNQCLLPGGLVYIGELHPYKQYTGTKARFETEQGQQVLDCYDHHLSDFVQSAKKEGLLISDLNEYFDEDDRSHPPRILTLMLRKP